MNGERSHWREKEGGNMFLTLLADKDVKKIKWEMQRKRQRGGTIAEEAQY